MRLGFQNLTWGHLSSQVIRVKLDVALDRIRNLTRLFTAEFEPASFEFQHVLKPRLGPPARDYIAAHLFLLRHQWSEAASIAQPKNENSLGIDEVVTLQRAKGSAIGSQLGLKIGVAAKRTFAVSDARLVRANQNVTRLRGYVVKQ